MYAVSRKRKHFNCFLVTLDNLSRQESVVWLPAVARDWIRKWQRCSFKCTHGSCWLGALGVQPSLLETASPLFCSWEPEESPYKARVRHLPNWLNLCLPMLFASMLINVNYGSGACDVLIIRAILFFCACTVCNTKEPWLGFPRCYK